MLSLRHRGALATVGMVNDIKHSPGPSASGRRSWEEVRAASRREKRRERRRLARGPGPGEIAVRQVRDG